MHDVMSPKKKILTEMFKCEDETSKTQASEDLTPVTNPVQSSAQQRALCNSLIVRNILSFISPSDLLNLRPVSRSFEEEVTSWLLSNKTARQTFQIKFTHCSQQGDYEHVYMGSLTDFLESCWKTSRRFPVLNFAFDFCEFETRDLLDFFKTVGEHVEGLSLNPSCDSRDSRRSLQLLKSILFEWSPNLKHLTLTSTPWRSSERLLPAENWRTGDNRWILSSLETLTLNGRSKNCSYRVIQDIIKSAPNLQLVSDSTLQFSEALVASQKFHLGLKTIKWEFKRETNRYFSAFADAKPEHLKEISLGFKEVTGSVIWADVGTALNNIFQAGCSSLEKIGTIPFLQDFANVDPLPVMEKVIEARFYQVNSSNRTTRVKVLPDGQTLEQVFPQLKTLSLTDLSTHEPSNPLFQCVQIHRHEGVTTLELAAKYESSAMPKWIQRAALLYPNLTTLEVQIIGVSILPATLRAIWTHFEGLEHLKLSVKIDGTFSLFGQNLPGEMDSAFTGIPVKMCHRLRRNLAIKRSGYKERENVDYLREYPSIWNLRKLKTFQFKISTPLTDFKRLFTPVSTVYAFQPMFEHQQLKASFGPVPDFCYEEKKGIWGVNVSNKKVLIVG